VGSASLSFPVCIPPPHGVAAIRLCVCTPVRLCLEEDLVFHDKFPFVVALACRHTEYGTIHCLLAAVDKSKLLSKLISQLQAFHMIWTDLDVILTRANQSNSDKQSRMDGSLGLRIPVYNELGSDLGSW
jgi:hypothetical protein